MSKTTIALAIILIIFIGILLFFLNNPQKNELVHSLTTQPITQTPPADTTLSLSTSTPTISAGQTVTIAVLIHSVTSNPDVIQFDLSYNPQIVTVNTITPGNFFKHPTVALETIDPVEGRITYALRCPSNTAHCNNNSSSTVALISLTISPYAAVNTTSFTFFPKTVIRSYTGKDLLKKTQGLQLEIAKPLNALSASSSAVSSPGAKKTPITPAK